MTEALFARVVGRAGPRDGPRSGRLVVVAARMSGPLSGSTSRGSVRPSATGELLAARIDGVLRVPSDFIQDGRILKGLPGLLTVLRDAGYADEDALQWLFTPDDSLPGTPVAALRENRGKEVRRRAQSLAW